MAAIFCLRIIWTRIDESRTRNLFENEIREFFTFSHAYGQVGGGVGLRKSRKFSPPEGLSEVKVVYESCGWSWLGFYITPRVPPTLFLRRCATNRKYILSEVEPLFPLPPAHTISSEAFSSSIIFASKKFARDVNEKFGPFSKAFTFYRPII